MTAAAKPPSVAVPGPLRRVRVLVCDDSAVFRGVLRRALESDPQIEVPHVAANGQEAIDAVKRESFDVVVLDIEMPVMDGLTALPKIIAARRDVKVVVASTLTKRNAAISMRALERGAADYLTKPTTSGYLAGEGEDFRRDLIAKVKGLAGANRAGAVVGTARASGHVPQLPRAATGVAPALRKAPLRRPEIVAIGSSTGGPQALMAMLSQLKDDLRAVPVLITQHMPPTFTQILAEHVARATGLRAAEAVDGEPVVAGRVYVAPGDYHMEVTGDPAHRVIRLNQGPRENFCRPAVDPMLRGVVESYGGNVLTVILTGMGQDGLHGGRKVVEEGGEVVAQDEATSVVWGMPGAVATAGICSAVLPLGEIAGYVRRALGRGRP